MVKKMGKGKEEKQILKVEKHEEAYPRLLKTIKDPPESLHYIGDISLCKEPCIAIVGSRKSTAYGKWASFNLGKILAEHGIVVVSGMASGIDSESHKGALAADGKTIAVLGCGPDVCYPKTNKALMESIKETGLIMSEYQPGSHPLPWMFPARNRIISGISYGVIIVEGDMKSGSLITAGHALEQGREVFALPGNIDSVYSSGTNKLIQDGATPLISIESIIEFLGLEAKAQKKKKSFAGLGKDEIAILRLIEKHGYLSHDDLVTLSGKQAGQVGALLTILELKGEIRIALGKIQVAK